MSLEFYQDFHLDMEYSRQTNPELSFGRGEWNHTHGNHREALLDFSAYLKVHPQDFKSMMYIAEIYCHTKRYKEAIPFYENAFNLAGGTFGDHVYVNYAVCYQMLQDFEKSLHIIDEFLERVKNFAPAFLAKAQIFLQTGKYDTSYYYATKAIELDGKNWNTYATRMKVDYCLGDYNRVAFDFKNAEMLNPELPATYYTTYAFSLYNSNKKKEAIAQFEKAKLLGDEEAQTFLKKITN